MIPKAERDADKAICEAATPDWQQGHHVGEPKALCSARFPDESLLMLDKDGMAIFWHEVDARAAVTARNRLPLYIADAEEMDRRITAVDALMKKYENEGSAHAVAQEYVRANESFERRDALLAALRILRGEK